MLSDTPPQALIEATDQGLVCAAGGFVIDPWKRAKISLITHAHADHARRVADVYYAAESAVPLLRKRLGDDIDVRGVPFGKSLSFNDTRVSFHPAGHVLGSAQIRVEHQGDVWVFTGDYKRDSDPSCEAFELVPCNTLITEATFALPVYRWQPGPAVAREIFEWWQQMKKADRPAVLFAYSLGKAQRVLAELTAFTDEEVFLHGAVYPLTEIYREAGVHMLPGRPIDLTDRKFHYGGRLVIAPPGASGSTWMRRFKNASTGFCSGWMRVRGNRRRRGHDRGFVLSDHADWPGLLQTIDECGAERVLTTHGQSATLVRYLREQGIDASELTTRFSTEGDGEGDSGSGSGSDSDSDSDSGNDSGSGSGSDSELGSGRDSGNENGDGNGSDSERNSDSDSDSDNGSGSDSGSGSGSGSDSGSGSGSERNNESDSRSGSDSDGDGDGDGDGDSDSDSDSDSDNGSESGKERESKNGRYSGSEPS